MGYNKWTVREIVTRVAVTAGQAGTGSLIASGLIGLDAWQTAGVAAASAATALMHRMLSAAAESFPRIDWD